MQNSDEVVPESTPVPNTTQDLSQTNNMSLDAISPSTSFVEDSKISSIMVDPNYIPEIYEYAFS
jgi:hypothetical protein